MKLILPLLAFTLLLSCGSVPPQVGQTGQSQLKQADLDRKIDLMIRSQFTIPAASTIHLGPRTPSQIPGFDNLPITITVADTNTNATFLISKDDKILARLDTFNLDANPALNINVKDRPIRGNPSAPVTVVNFDDLECPVCAYLHKQLFPAVFDRYGDQVRFIYKDNPLINLHPWALHAAVNAACLASESAASYWSYVDYVHAHAQQVSGTTRELDRSFATLDQIATDQFRGSPKRAQQLQSCIKRQDEAPVRQSMKEASQLRLDFTPALFVNGEEIRGYTTMDDLSVVIDRALRDQGLHPRSNSGKSDESKKRNSTSR